MDCLTDPVIAKTSRGLVEFIGILGLGDAAIFNLFQLNIPPINIVESYQMQS